MKNLFLALPLILLSINLGACAWAGQKTGKAVTAVERGATEFEQGYKQERSSRNPQTPAEPRPSE